MKSNHKHWLIIANGDPLPEAQLRQLAQGKNILALDGAYQQCQDRNLKPDILLGDFDSINAAQLTQAQQNPELQVQHAPDQNKTDLEKGIAYVLSLDAQSIAISSAIGSRLDHSLFNLRILKRYHNPTCPLRLYSQHETVVYLEDQTVELSGSIGQGIGILGAPEGSLSSCGLKYDVSDFALRFGESSSICNQFASEQVSLQIRGGALCVIELSDFSEKM